MEKMRLPDSCRRNAWWKVQPEEALAKFGHPGSLSTTANARSSESESNEREFCEPRPLGSRFSEFCKSLGSKQGSLIGTKLARLPPFGNRVEAGISRSR